MRRGIVWSACSLYSGHFDIADRPENVGEYLDSTLAIAKMYSTRTGTFTSL